LRRRDGWRRLEIHRPVIARRGAAIDGEAARKDDDSTMSQPDHLSASSSTDTPAHWGRQGGAPRARDLTGADLGDFQVDRLLGRGGMGEVYLARQISLNREVALKVLRPDLLTNPTYLSRFEAEAWSAAKLNHPNIVHIYTLGIVEGLRFIAMEYVHGTNLREYLTRKGPPDLPQALSNLRQAGAAVGAAGEVGLVHRDIKPENLLLTRKGQVKVADFGLCRDLDDDRHHITQPGVTMGTPLYMSPEQARGQAMDHRSDLYSLGVTYYHMLAGHPPFRAETALALAMKHVVDTPVDLAVHRPDLPAGLTRLVMKLMAKSAADRHQSAAEMLRDLNKVREALQASALAASGAAGAEARPDPASTTPEAPASPEGRPAARRQGVRPLAWPSPKVMVLASVVGLGSGVAAGWIARPADLLAADPKGRHAPPALWIAPDWEQVPREATAAEQYRHALLLASPGDLEAAWVAVSGYFPRDQEWASRSYTQLARELFRRRDRDRLKALADVLDTTHYGSNEALARVMLTAVAALDGDVGKVLDFFDANLYSTISNLVDAAVADFGLEITLRLREDRRIKLTGSVGDKLRSVQGRLVQKLIEIKRRDLQG